MRSKAPLAMMEQMVMLLVFALAAALCLQAFVKSDELSRQSEARDRAMALCQNAAEAIRSTGGDLPAAAALLDVPFPFYQYEDEPLAIYYNEDWTLSTTREYAYCLRVEPVDSGVTGLGKANVSVAETASADTVFELSVAWQEDQQDAGQKENHDQARSLCRSMAETILQNGGYNDDLVELLGAQCEHGLMWLDYDENWNPNPEAGSEVYRLEVLGSPSELPGMREASVYVVNHGGQDNKVLFAIKAAWQEVSADG